MHGHIWISPTKRPWYRFWKRKSWDWVIDSKTYGRTNLPLPDLLMWFMNKYPGYVVVMNKDPYPLPCDWEWSEDEPDKTRA